MIDKEQVIWAAGLFDGEGTVICVPNGALWKNVRISLPQAHPAVVWRFWLAVRKLGSVDGPYSRGENKSQYIFQTAKFEHVQAIVAMMWKWLSRPKKDQAIAAFKEFARYQEQL